jgi:hypothetical protein
MSSKKVNKMSSFNFDNINFWHTNRHMQRCIDQYVKDNRVEARFAAEDGEYIAITPVAVSYHEPGETPQYSLVELSAERYEEGTDRHLPLQQVGHFPPTRTFASFSLKKGVRAGKECYAITFGRTGNETTYSEPVAFEYTEDAARKKIETLMTNIATYVSARTHFEMPIQERIPDLAKTPHLHFWER